jgi:hypothetical protein
VIPGQRVLKGCEKERTEAAAVGTQILEMTAIEQRGQKALSQVTRVVGIRAAPANVGIKRIPVRFTERGEGGPACCRVFAACSRNQAPSRRLKHDEILLRQVSSRTVNPSSEALETRVRMARHCMTDTLHRTDLPDLPDRQPAHSASTLSDVSVWWGAQDHRSFFAYVFMLQGVVMPNYLPS